MSWLEVGKRVKVRGHGGTVRFLGYTQFARTKREFVGVEFDEPVVRELHTHTHTHTHIYTLSLAVRDGGGRRDG